MKTVPTSIRHCALASGVAAALLAATAAPASAVPTIVEYALPNGVSGPAGAEPLGIARGPDGNVWFTESTSFAIGKIDPNGTVTIYQTPGPYPPGPGGPVSVVAGPDGAMWATDPVNNRIDRVTTSGTYTTFALPTASAGPFGIAVGADGNLWFTEKNASKVGRITPQGTITEFATPSPTAVPEGIALAADGNVWFVETGTGLLGSVTPQGAITETGGDHSLQGSIASGPNGSLWFTAVGDGCGGCSPRSTGRVDVRNANDSRNAFDITDSVGYSAPQGITQGPDGNMWFVERFENAVSSITPDGRITAFTIPTVGQPSQIVTGADGNLWFTETGADKIGKLVLNSVPVTLGGYLSGNWYDPSQAGQGFQLEFTGNGNSVIAIWFTFAPDGSGQNWIYAQGTYDTSKNSVTLPAILAHGAKFPPNFKPGDVTDTPWGTLTFTFDSCSTGTVTWSSTLPGYGTGSLPLTRLTQIAGTSCAFAGAPSP